MKTNNQTIQILCNGYCLNNEYNISIRDSIMSGISDYIALKQAINLWKHINRDNQRYEMLNAPWYDKNQCIDNIASTLAMCFNTSPIEIDNVMTIMVPTDQSITAITIQYINTDKDAADKLNEELSIEISPWITIKDGKRNMRQMEINILDIIPESLLKELTTSDISSILYNR